MRVELIDRPEVEPDERFLVRLSSDDPAIHLNPRETSILILDDDGIGRLELLQVVLTHNTEMRDIDLLNL